MKTYVIYHGNCYDGFGAALAAKIHFGENPEIRYIPALYGHPLPQVETGGNVFMLDISWPREQLRDWQEENKLSLTILDHHKTAEADLANFPGATFDMNKSGAVLAYEHFFPGEEVPEFFLYLQDRDLWKYTLPESEEVSMAMRSYPMDFAVWYDLIGNVEKLKEEGRVAKRLTDQQVSNMADQVKWALFSSGGTAINGSEEITFPWFIKFVDYDQPIGHLSEFYVVPVANATVFFSEVANELLNRNPEASFAAYYMDRGDGKRQWGLRSRPDFDVSEIAKKYGGGGHAQAAGFVL